MSAEVSKLLLIAAVVTVLVGLAGTYYRRRWGSVIALAGLTVIGAALATILLSPEVLSGSNDPEAKIWQERHDFVQRDLQIAREKELATRRSLEDAEKVGRELRSELEGERRAHATVQTALDAEILRRQRADSLREGAEKTEQDARQTIAKLESLASSLRSDIERLEAALKSEQAANLKLREDFEVDKERTKREIDSLKIEKRAIEVQRDKSVADLSTANESLATLNQALVAAQNTIQELRRQPPSDSIASSDLKILLEGGLFGRRYEIYRVLHPPAINGRVGTYYAIKLKAASDGASPEPFEFAIGKYTLTSGDDRFLEAVHDLFEDVIRKIQGPIAWELFVRGTADEREFRSPPSTAGHEGFRVVRYLPKEQPETNRYLNVPKDQRLGPVLRNQHLPNLRAAFVAKLVHDRMSQLQALGPEPTILEETPKGPPRSLSPELFLLISW